MKKFGAFLFAASVLAAPMAAQAVDVTATGAASFRATYMDNIDYSEDNIMGFHMGQNLLADFKFAASENLFMSFAMQAYSTGPGYGSAGYQAMSDLNGGAGSDLMLLFANLNYTTLEDKLNIVIGTQSGANNSYTFGLEQAGHIPLAGVRARYKATDTITIDAGWYRPYADQAIGGVYNLEDTAVDAFQIRVPMAFGNINVTPLAHVVILGKNAGEMKGNPLALTPKHFSMDNFGARGALNIIGASAHDGALGVWAGFTGKMNINEQLAVSADVLYGSTDFEKSTSSDRAGFLAGVHAAYTMDFGTINALAWYSSGEDDDNNNGSEALPQYYAVSTSFNPVAKLGGVFAHDIHFDGDASMTLPGFAAGNPEGTMAIGAGISNMSFMDKLYHSFWGLYAMGTHDKASLIASSGHNYLTTEDSVLQFGATNWYALERNLIWRAEAVYALAMYDTKLRPAFDDNAIRLSTSLIYFF